MENVFESLSDSFPEGDPIDKLLAYFKSTYIQGPILQRPALFPLELWNHFQHAINKALKTPNCTEGWHHSLVLLLASHSSMWTLFRGLKKDIAIQRLTVINADIEHNGMPKLKYQELVQRLSSARKWADMKKMTNWSGLLSGLWHTWHEKKSLWQCNFFYLNSLGSVHHGLNPPWPQSSDFNPPWPQPPWPQSPWPQSH